MTTKIDDCGIGLLVEDDKSGARITTHAKDSYGTNAGSMVLLLPLRAHATGRLLKIPQSLFFLVFMIYFNQDPKQLEANQKLKKNGIK